MVVGQVGRKEGSLVQMAGGVVVAVDVGIGVDGS